MALDPRTHLELAKARAEDLGRAAARARGSSLPYGPAPTPASPAELSVVIRRDRPQDQRALTRLAGLDSASVPRSPLLLAEVGGELRAAVSLADGAAIADPFHRTASLLALLRMRAEQLRGDGAGAPRRLGRLRRVAGRATAAVLPRA
jgi:hypothetical protein